MLLIHIDNRKIQMPSWSWKKEVAKKKEKIISLIYRQCSFSKSVKAYEQMLLSLVKQNKITM